MELCGGKAARIVLVGSPVLFLYEKLAMAHDALAALGASPWPAETAPQLPPPGGPVRPAPPGASRLT